MNVTACASVVLAWGSRRQEDQQFKALDCIGRWGPAWFSRDPVSKGEPKMLEWMSFHTHQSKWKYSVYCWCYQINQDAIHFRKEDHLKELGRELKSLLLSPTSAWETRRGIVLYSLPPRCPTWNPAQSRHSTNNAKNFHQWEAPQRPLSSIAFFSEDKPEAKQGIQKFFT